MGDVAQEETARGLAQEAVSAFGHIDVLVNNAGVFFDKDITDMTVEEWDRLMDVNLKSMFVCCKHVIPEQVSFLLCEVELHRALGDGKRGKAYKKQKCGDEQFHIAE